MNLMDEMDDELGALVHDGGLIKAAISLAATVTLGVALLGLFLWVLA